MIFSPSMRASKSWGLGERLALFGLMLTFVGFASYRIHSPGLYYDELLFAPAAMGRHASFQAPYRSWLGIPLMVFPYIGALKAWIYAPIFRILGVSALTIRLPVIFISCGTLALGYAVVRKVLSPAWAVAFTAACVVHPGFVLQTKVDWGPVVLMLFFKALCIYFLIKWLETPRLLSWSLIGMFVACGLGFFDKLNFVWFIVALVVATAAVYGGEIRTRLKNAPKDLSAVIVIAIAATGAATVLWFVLPLVALPQLHLISRKFLHFWAVYEYSSTGAATACHWFKKPPQIPLWPGWAMLAAGTGFLLLTLAFCCYKPRARFQVHSRTLRFSVWCLIMFVVVFTEIVMTPQAGGPHHTLMLFPLDVLACFAAAFVFAKILPVWGRRVATIFCGLALVIWGGFQIQGLQSHFCRFGDPNLLRGPLSPRVEELADYLNTNGKQLDAIYSVDWGIGKQMQVLCRREIRKKLRDIWPVFKNWSAEKPDAEVTVKALFPPQKKTLYLTFTDENSVFQDAKHNFSQMNMLAEHAAQPVTTVPPALGTVYEVFLTGAEQGSIQPGPWRKLAD
jgi:4-amino-4-deoxy-L-arabinose transferase-like glycosyltransferase